MTHKLADWQIAELLDDEPVEEVDEWLEDLICDMIEATVAYVEEFLEGTCHYTAEQIAGFWEQQLIPNWIEHGWRNIDREAAYVFLDDVIAKQSAVEA